MEHVIISLQIPTLMNRITNVNKKTKFEDWAGGRDEILLNINIEEWLKLYSLGDLDEYSEYITPSKFLKSAKVSSKFKFVSDNGFNSIDSPYTTYKSGEYKDNGVEDNWSINMCKSSAILDSDAFQELREKYVNQPDPSKNGHKEYGGLLTFTPIDVNSGGCGLYCIKYKKNSIIKGSYNETDVPEGEGNFHIHPEGEYKRIGVPVAWPSGDDYKAILEKMIDPDENCILHLVVTREGVYIVTFDKNASKKGKDVYINAKKNIVSMYKRDLPGKTDEECGSECKSKLINEYLEKIKGLGIFSVNFVNWDEIIGKEKRVDFYYPQLNGGTCDPSKRTK